MAQQPYTFEIELEQKYTHKYTHYQPRIHTDVNTFGHTHTGTFHRDLSLSLYTADVLRIPLMLIPAVNNHDMQLKVTQQFPERSAVYHG